MKLLCLNIWGGMLDTLLFEYISQQSKSVDIFCFQEVFSSPPELGDIYSHGVPLNLLKKIEELLPEFASYFAPASKGHDLAELIEGDVSYGLAIFVKKNIQVLSHSSFILRGSPDQQPQADFSNLGRVLQQVSIKKEEKTAHIFNIHGIDRPWNKLDSPERLEQSKKILACMETFKGYKILCGDFNLEPNTESVRILESELINLIGTYKITTTRNQVSWSMFPESTQRFADFTFVSPGLRVNNFNVPDNEVSDHLPMIIEFQL